MRTDGLLLAALCALAGCATSPLPPREATRVAAPAIAAPCREAASPRGESLCSYPIDVRTFVEDRDLCDHFRGEPWPEGDSDADRSRRLDLVEGARRACAGTDARLAELKTRYDNDPTVLLLLSGFDERVGD